MRRLKQIIVCGIEIKGSDAIFTVLKKENDEITDITKGLKKLTLKGDEDSNNVKSFVSTLHSYFDNVNPNEIAIKTRGKTGEHSGGALSFKIEGLIQLYPKKNVELVTFQKLGAYIRKHSEPVNSGYKYQKESNKLAFYLLNR